MTRLRDLCKGRWPGILAQHGVPSTTLNGKHGPCPLCPGNGGKDRFRFDDRDGYGTYFCSQCGSGDGIKFLQELRGLEFKQVAELLEPIVGSIEAHASQPKTSPDKVRRWMENLWKQARAVQLGDPVDLYLRSRGIVLDTFPTQIRFDPSCKYDDARHFPAMLSIFQGECGKAGQLHRTYLTEDGAKAPVEPVRKQMPMAFPDSGAVRLFGYEPAIGIAEGIETALAASILHCLPVWSVLNTALMLKFQPPEELEELFIFADNDANFAGQSKAYGLAEKLMYARPGLHVQVVVPPSVGTDWNDVLLGQSQSRSAA